MNSLNCLGPDQVAVDIEDMRHVFTLLKQAKTLHESGRYEAHAAMDKAMAALEKLISKAVE